MAQVSIPGGSGTPPLIFTVTGNSTTNLAYDFQNQLIALNGAGHLTINTDPLTQTAPAGMGVLNEFNSVSGAIALSYPGQYTYVTTTSSATVDGSARGADFVVAGGGVTYESLGASNDVVFTDGDNTYDGTNGFGSDTVGLGSGNDTVKTGTGPTTVFGGTGSGDITLNDTAPAGDIVYLGDGTNTVSAFGMNDTVATASPGQTIYAGGTGDTDTFVLTGDSVMGPGDDSIAGGTGANVTVFDNVGGDTISAGSGALTFVGGAGIFADTIFGGTGTTNIFAADGDSITYISGDTDTSATFVAGAGNETLNGAFGDGGINFFGNVGDTSQAVSVTGGAGNDYFSTGAGTETLDGGTGNDLFSLNLTTDGSGAAITINDFSATDSVTGAITQDEINAGTVSDGNLTITLSDNTQVEFVGITDVTSIHLV